MNSFLKGLAHAAASSIIMILPMLHMDWLNLTLGAVVSIIANWVLSQTVPTTTGASANQNSPVL